MINSKVVESQYDMLLLETHQKQQETFPKGVNITNTTKDPNMELKAERLDIEGMLDKPFDV
eukprot:865104-Amphidinium_carterae.1